MVPPMHPDPLTGHHTGGHPQPEAEEMGQYRVQVQGTVCLTTVQIDRDCDDRHVGQDQDQRKQLPPSKIE